jgi:hypothetical protein
LKILDHFVGLRHRPTLASGVQGSRIRRIGQSYSQTLGLTSDLLRILHVSYVTHARSLLFLCPSSGQTSIWIIALLNSAYPDHDFTSVRPDHFIRENGVNDVLRQMSATVWELDGEGPYVCSLSLSVYLSFLLRPPISLPHPLDPFCQQSTMFKWLSSRAFLCFVAFHQTILQFLPLLFLSGPVPSFSSAPILIILHQHQYFPRILISFKTPLNCTRAAHSNPHPPPSSTYTSRKSLTLPSSDRSQRRNSTLCAREADLDA